MKPFSCVWRRNMINATRTSSFEVWKPHICKNICFASRWINMFLCTLFTCLSVDPHICICIYADFWGGSHTQQGSLSVTVSQCEFVSLCLVLLGMSMCVSVCVNLLGYVGLFSQSICFLDLSVDVSFYTFSISLCVCVYMCHTASLTSQSGPQLPDGALYLCLVSEYLSCMTAYQYPLWMWRDAGYTFTMFSFYNRPWIVLPHLCFYQMWYIFVKVWVKLAKVIHIKMEVTQMCSPCPLTSSSILMSSGNSHYGWEIVWPFRLCSLTEMQL